MDAELPLFVIVVRELRSVLSRHGVTLRPTRDGHIEIHSAVDSPTPAPRFDDQLDPPEDPAPPEIPRFYAGLLRMAQAHPGYVGAARSSRNARELAKKTPGSKVIPVGKPARAWVVVVPKPVDE